MSGVSALTPLGSPLQPFSIEGAWTDYTKVVITPAGVGGLPNLAGTNFIALRIDNNGNAFCFYLKSSGQLPIIVDMNGNVLATSGEVPADGENAPSVDSLFSVLRTYYLAVYNATTFNVLKSKSTGGNTLVAQKTSTFATLNNTAPNAARMAISPNAQWVTIFENASPNPRLEIWKGS